jgi:hypothetical protein
MVLSVAIEAAVAALLVAALRWGLAWRAAAAAAFGTLATHHWAWQDYPVLDAALGPWGGYLAVECAVALFECVGYRLIAQIDWARALLVSVAANAASAGAGLALEAFGLM